MTDSFETAFIPETIEKTPFEDTPTQNFFTKWCEINDSIVPVYVSREEWQKRSSQGVLEKNDQDKLTLFLPTDLHLWEMKDIIRQVDHDTFERNPIKQSERINLIHDLGVTFEKAGLYLSEYLPNLDSSSGRPVAQNMARDFYRYGLSLQGKTSVSAESLADAQLTSQDKTLIDEWLLGKAILGKRLARLGGNPSKAQIENERKKLLQVYFTALNRDGFKRFGDTPWDTDIGPFKHLHDISNERITSAINTPETEMTTAIFRRGVEKLVTQMRLPNWQEHLQTFIKAGISQDIAAEKLKLINSLELPTLKMELEELRQSGELNKICEKELEIAKKIHKAVSSFQYGSQANNPSEMIESQLINCVGASLLGGGLMEEVGIRYLLSSLPGHSATVLITSNEKLYWQDFSPGGLSDNYREISSDMVEQDLDVSNIPKEGLFLDFTDWNPYSFLKGKLRVRLTKPNTGLQSQILNNVGLGLQKLGFTTQAIEAFEQAISIDPSDPYPYNSIGNALKDLGRTEEAIEAFNKVISIDPDDAVPYNGLGNALIDLGRIEEAIDAFKKAISIEPDDPDPYNGLGISLSDLGRTDEAIDAFKKAINLNPKSYPPMYNLGVLYENLGKLGEAINAFNRHNEIVNNPDDKWVLKANKRILNIQKRVVQ